MSAHPIVGVADRAVAHPIVERVMAELRGNLGVSDSGLPAYGIAKVAHYAAQVGAAIALGLDPEVLRVSGPDAAAHLEQIIAACVAAGIPLYVVDGGDQ